MAAGLEDVAGFGERMQVWGTLSANPEVVLQVVPKVVPPLYLRAQRKVIMFLGTM